MSEILELLKQETTLSGYQKLPNGMIIQWGETTGDEQIPTPFPIPFPTACLLVVPTLIAELTEYQMIAAYWSRENTTNTHVRIGRRFVTEDGDVGLAVQPARYIAIGH